MAVCLVLTIDVYAQEYHSSTYICQQRVDSILQHSRASGSRRFRDFRPAPSIFATTRFGQTRRRRGWRVRLIGRTFPAAATGFVGRALLDRFLIRIQLVWTGFRGNATVLTGWGHVVGRAVEVLHRSGVAAVLNWPRLELTNFTILRQTQF